MAQITMLVPVHHAKGIVAFALVDAEEYSKIAPYRWRLDDAGYVVRSASLEGKSHRVRLHRELLSLPHAAGRRAQGRIEGDHENRNKLDNRRSNLRVVTHAQNLENTPRRRGSRSEHRGVGLKKATGKWVAYCKVNGHMHWLGSFDDEQEAAVAAREGRQRLMTHAGD